MRRIVTTIALCALATFACQLEDGDRSGEREGEILLEQVEDAQAAAEACVDDLLTCIDDAAGDPDAIAACAEGAPDCVPEIPDLPDPPDLPDDVPCQDELDACINGGVAVIGGCAASLQGCIEDEVNALCLQAVDACVAAGAPPAICDQIADNC